MKMFLLYRESYEHIPEWLLEAKRHIAPHEATLLLVGCKHDLASQGNFMARIFCSDICKKKESILVVVGRNAFYMKL